MLYMVVLFLAKCECENCACCVVCAIYFTENMASGKRMSNGYHLRRRSIPPQLQSTPKVVIPKSLININDPVKSEHLMKHFVAKMKKSEGKKVIFKPVQQVFSS